VLLDRRENQPRRLADVPHARLVPVRLEEPPLPLVGRQIAAGQPDTGRPAEPRLEAREQLPNQIVGWANGLVGCIPANRKASGENRPTERTAQPAGPR